MALFELAHVKWGNLITYPNLKIKKGITTFITGESGTGKSTLLKLLNGVLTPDSGSVYYVDQPVLDMDAIRLRRQVLLISQAVVLFDEQSIKENFSLFLNYRDQKVPSDDEIKGFLTTCSLDIPLNKCVYELSGGQKQRVFIAIHLALGFDVLLMDEPTSALDENNSYTLLANIKSYCKEKDKSLIIVSHDQAIVANFADDLIVLGGDALC